MKDTLYTIMPTGGQAFIAVEDQPDGHILLTISRAGQGTYQGLFPQTIADDLAKMLQAAIARAGQRRLI